MNETDRRVKRTRKLLAKALIALALEHGYEQVTIQAITVQAGVGYRTFFRHYADKDALLYDVLETTVMELRELMKPPAESSAEWGQDAIRNGRILFQHAQENSDLYRVLLNSGAVMLEPVQKFARRETIRGLSLAENGSVLVEMLSHHIVSALFNLLRWWLDNDMPYSPEQMGVYAAQLIMKPAQQLIKSTNPSQ